MAPRALKPGETAIPLDTARPRVRARKPDETVIFDSTLVQQFGGAANRMLASLTKLPIRLAPAILDPATEAMTGRETTPPRVLHRKTLGTLSWFAAPPPQTHGQRIAARAGRGGAAALPLMTLPLLAPVMRSLPLSERLDRNHPTASRHLVGAPLATRRLA